MVAPTVDGRMWISNAANAWWLLVRSLVFMAEEPIGPGTPTSRSPRG